MNDLNQFMDGPYKKIEPWVKLAFFVMVSIGGGLGIAAIKNQHIFSGEGFYIFLMVIYWLVIGISALCILLKIIQKFAGNTSSNGYPQQNMAAAQNFNSNMNNGFAAMPQNNTVPQPAAEKFCTHCGAKIPDGSQFCTSCGNKA